MNHSTHPGVTPGSLTRGKNMTASERTSPSSLSISPPTLFMSCMRAIIPSRAFRAILTSKATAKTQSMWPLGKSHSRTPVTTDRRMAVQVMALALTPALCSTSSNGLQQLLEPRLDLVG